MKILIFGAGALGQALGCMLSENGHSVDLVLRERYGKAIRENGLSVTGIFGDHFADMFKTGTYSGIGEITGTEYDYAIITTKSYDTTEAVESILKIKKTPGFVVSMQNGCGNLEMVAEAFGRERTLGARVITGFEIETPGKVKITVSADDIHIGAPDEGDLPKAAVKLAEAIDKSGIPCSATRYINRDLFAKLLYSCALNPLGALLGVHYGALGENASTRSIMERIIGEVFAVIDAMGAKTHWESPEEYIGVFYGKQLPATFKHRSSMLQDINASKRTEIEALTGYVVQQGKKLGIPVPVSETITEMIRFKEKSRV